MSTKTCKICHECKDVSNFYPENLCCKACYSNYVAKIVKCTDCGQERRVVTSRKYFALHAPRCRSCAQKFSKGKPENRQKQSEIARQQLLKQGGIQSDKPKWQVNGDKHPNWKGGITPELMKIRVSSATNKFRSKVFERDNYTCRRCGQRGGKLNAHHIYSFQNYPDLRLEVNNGVTLCVDCHRKLHRAIKIFKRTFIATALIFLISLTSFSQPSKGTFWQLLKKTTVAPPTVKAFTIDTVNIAATVDTLAPARGSNSFYGSTTPNSGQAFQIPVAGQNQIALDDDTRFTWADLQPTSAGVFNWASLDVVFHNAIDLGKRQSIGIVTVCSDCSTAGNPVVGGAKLCYPVFLHNQMQAETIKDWQYLPGGAGNAWIPAWNSPSYLAAYRAFLTGLRDYINTTSYKGVPYSSVVYKIDIRGMGNYGEWHFSPWINCGCIPAGTMPTEATLDSLVSMHIQVFPNTWLIGNINMLVDNNMPPNFGFYFLTHANNMGASGIRSDHLANIGTVNFDTIVLASRTVSGLNFKTAWYTRYITAPMNGEPMNDVAAVSQGGPFPYYDLDREVRLWGLSQFSNVSSSADANTQTMFRTASKSTGYKVKIRGGTVSNNVPSGNPIQVRLFWANTGIAPVYENWTVQIILRNAGGVVAFTGQSTFVLRLFQASGATVISTDNFSLPGLPAGVYRLEVIVVDPLAYRKPFPLHQHGLFTGGSYILTTINII